MDEGGSYSGGGSNTIRNILLAVAAVYVIASLFFIFQTRSRLASLEKAQQAAIADLTKRLEHTDTNLKTSTEALGARLGMTEQDLQARMAARAEELERQQKQAERRLAEQQKRTSGEVAGVKTELGTAKTDIASTRTDLEATKAKLERAMGDLGLQSGLIARTREDLDELRRRGERNYYEFTLTKGQSPTPVSTVSLQLKKADKKRSKFTLNVIADDRTIEKKDRTVAEPLQFYTGRDRMLYELVVFTVEKNKVTGYLSTPKSAPVPVSK
ncbi:MAG: hypothetical protein ACE14M_14620 [Terriglobales bacterium]